MCLLQCSVVVCACMCVFTCVCHSVCLVDLEEADKDTFNHAASLVPPPSVFKLPSYPPVDIFVLVHVKAFICMNDSECVHWCSPRCLALT